MRISDWSSDVCSSDLPCAERKGSASRHRKRRACRNDQRAIAWKTCAAPDDRAVVDAGEGILRVVASGRLVGCRLAGSVGEMIDCDIFRIEGSGHTLARRGVFVGIVNLSVHLLPTDDTGPAHPLRVKITRRNKI